jgi:prepilin-type processing-associated H-X9-DG protein
LGVLASLLLPAVQAAREAARRSACIGRLSQLALAVRNHESTMQQFPSGRVGCDTTPNNAVCPPGLPPEGYNAASGFVTLLPQIEMQALYDQLGVQRGGLWNRNVDDLDWADIPAKYYGVQQIVPSFVCPTSTAKPISDVYPVPAATGSYALVQGTKGPHSPRPEAKYDNDGMFVYVTPRRSSEATDGLSRTLLVGEVIMADAWESSNTWTYARLNADSLRTTEYPLNTLPGTVYTYEGQSGAFGSEHAGGGVFVYGDGHVEFMSDEIELPTYRSLSTMAGDEL